MKAVGPECVLISCRHVLSCMAREQCVVEVSWNSINRLLLSTEPKTLRQQSGNRSSLPILYRGPRMGLCRCA